MRLIALVFALSIAAIAGTDTTECKKKNPDCPRMSDSTAVMDSTQCKKKKDCCKKKSAEECPRKKEHCPKKSS
jgi:hypothetical protein